ncbi:MAG TPA: hypothetical protein VLT58_17560 [Polyangia bacterium]|nr:hypothetical protein [Polyangia bacterium]
MAPNRLARGLSLFLVAAGAAACGGEGQGAATGPIAVASITENSLTANSLTANSLTANSLTANSLTANSLTANGLADPLTMEFLKYVASCALGPKQSLDLTVAGQSFHMPGSLGLAPQWGMSGGSCDKSCQRWITACVLSRVDAAGVEREISIRGLNPALLPGRTELATYTEREATYFGNVFAPGQPKFLCLPPGATSDQRVCGDSMTNCPMTVLGSCAKDCLFQGPFGEFDICSSGGKIFAGDTYFESITVFLPKSTM